MGRHIHSGLPWTAAFAVAALALAGTPALGANTEYCVTCKGPAGTYRCRVRGSGVKASDALKLYCVVRTAKEGGHASCSAKKASSDCAGPMKVYNYDGPALPERLTSDPRIRELSRKMKRSRQTFEEPSGDEPKSLYELGGRAVDASRRGLRNAGSAVGLGSSSESEVAPPPVTASARPPAPPQQAAGTEPDDRGFARRSYDCVLSFFRECGSRE